MVGVVAFWRAWEAWGIWAIGGFEAVFIGGLADDLPAVIAAFDEVSAPVMAELFRRAAAVLPADIVTSFDARTAFFESGDEDAACAALQGWKELDREMDALPDIKGRLWGGAAGARRPARQTRALTRRASSGSA